MNDYKVKPIGEIVVLGCDSSAEIHLKKEFIPALTGLDGFGYIQVLWWFNECDNTQMRMNLLENSAYKNGPDMLGTFATRTPKRPNPIALTSAKVSHIDFEKGIIGLCYIDANNNSPVLDIKPYTPSLDRIEKLTVPDWCANWPRCNEESGNFDWSSVFNF